MTIAGKSPEPCQHLATDASIDSIHRRLIRSVPRRTSRRASQSTASPQTPTATVFSISPTTGSLGYGCVPAPGGNLSRNSDPFSFPDAAAPGTLRFSRFAPARGVIRVPQPSVILLDLRSRLVTDAEFAPVSALQSNHIDIIDLSLSVLENDHLSQLQTFNSVRSLKLTRTTRDRTWQTVLLSGFLVPPIGEGTCGQRNPRVEWGRRRSGSYSPL